MKTNRLFSSLAALGAASLVLASCATQPIYRPREEGGRIGYTDERISENRARVSFSGSTTTGRRVVEDYLLLRAAEVTLNAGYESFVFDDKNTETERSYYRNSFDQFGDWPYWQRTRFGGWYYSNWIYDDPFGRDPFDRGITTTTRYSAYAEIVMLHAAQLGREPRAISAREVINRLRPPPPPPQPTL